MNALAEPYFDCELNAWVLSRYQDVASALREPLLAPSPARPAGAAVALDAAQHAQFRAEALRALTPPALQPLQAEMATLAARMAGALREDRPVDLVGEYAKPWSLEVARVAAEVPLEEVERLADMARGVFDAACEPYDAALDATARQASTELARHFQNAPPWHMQMFVALSHSLPGFLGLAWSALLQHPAAISRLRQEPALYPGAIDELLRFAGPARAQFRQAVGAVTINSCAIRQNQQVILRVDLANRDPEQFPQPDELQIEGRKGGHLALGTGPNACVGAVLVRSAAAVATKALLERFESSREYSVWQVDGFAVRHVRALMVHLVKHGDG
jgi:cytochrome P450